MATIGSGFEAEDNRKQPEINLTDLQGYSELPLSTQFALALRVTDYKKASKEQLLDLIVKLDNYQEVRSFMVNKMFKEDNFHLPDSLG